MIQIFNCRIDIRASSVLENDSVFHEHFHKYVNSVDDVDRYVEEKTRQYSLDYPGDESIKDRVVVSPAYVNLTPALSNKNPLCNTNINPMKSFLPIPHGK